MRQKLIIGIVVAAVGGLFAAGIFNWDKFTSYCRRFYYRGRGEVSRATTFTHPQVNNPQAAAACRQNLRTIENAKRKVAGQKGMAIGRLTWNDLKPEFPRGIIPKCAAGGEYVLGDVGTMPKCRIGNNKTPKSEDDHIVINY